MSLSADPDTATPWAPDLARLVIYWIPLGAGGAATVRVSGRIYEVVRALLERRRPRHVYHTALEVYVDGERFTIENAWPCPDDETDSRGVVVEGPLWSPWLRRLRWFRYEIRCWRDGCIAEVAEPVATPTLTGCPDRARRVLEMVRAVPALTWGRSPGLGGDMWTSNSVISYLLTVSGLPAESFRPPAGGRARGWDTGIDIARDLMTVAPSSR